MIPGHLAEILDGAELVICAGSGGVGKTTTAAAIAVGLAARGQRVAVVTIDPARRLADALGLGELGNQPTRVAADRFVKAGIAMTGELLAMTLDPKQTFDDLIAALAPDDRTRDEVLGNRIYQQLSGAIAGSQEFTAVAKVHELNASGQFDVLVLDTPPSRNALDFLDAPDRLTAFFDGRALRLFLTPTGIAARALGAGSGLVAGALRRLTGIDLLDELTVFFRALAGLIDGFRERADVVRALLNSPKTRFLIVTSPEREPVAEAIFFHGKLAEAGMPFGGLIVNRVNRAGEPGAAPLKPADVARDLEAELGPRLAAKVARTYGEALSLAERDDAAIDHLERVLGDISAIIVPELEGDVHDAAGLVAVHAHLFA